ncbi:MAG TPA: alpha/beta fold hydrolase [Kofleriaceae bacterium]|nr:alpha/beta fold hydrolase [Kofleriaceae bacterium]
MIGAVTADGVRLHLGRVQAQGARRGVVLCTHAMMAHGRYFGASRRPGFAAFLAERGIEVFVLDWRGHGLSRPPDPRRDQWCFDDYVELDLPAAIAAVCRTARIDPRELTILGHSLGGLATCAALGTGRIPPVRAIALAATNVWLNGPRGPRARRALMSLYDLSSRPFGFAPIRLARMGTDDEPRDYVAQLTTWARTGRWTSRTGVDYLASLDRIDVPAWAFVGAGDRFCRADDAEQIRSRLAHARPLRVVGEAHGDAFDADHFRLFTDGQMAPLWTELISFATS